MGILSSKLTTITFGVATSPNPSDTPPRLQRCIINPANGDVTGPGGDAGSGIWCSGEFKASKVWSAVWNDIADFQLLADKLELGKCYYDTKDGAKICTERCQMSVIGIASDTYGFGVGTGAHDKQVPIAVAGWVLAYVDQEYECGTPLTNDKDGNLTAMTRNEKMEYPERIVGIYKRKEMDLFWGPTGKQIEVKGRHWVKVK